MKKKIKILLIILLIIYIGLNNYVRAEETASLKVSLTSDISNLHSNNKLYYDIALIDIKNIDTSKPMALMAVLEYNTSILSNPTITGISPWTADINQNNNRFLIDCSSFTPDQTIATITFDTNIPENQDTTIKIALTDVQLLGGDDYDVSIDRIESGTIEINGTTPNNTTQNQTIPYTPTTTNTTTNYNITQEPKANIVGDKSTRNETVFTIGAKDDKVTQKVDSIEPVKDATTSNTPLPQAGVSYIIYIIIAIVVIIGIYTFIRDKKFYD
ncbi:MAG: hypothetical protein IKG14_05270 [Clostridia bacterium]|nr:hypothetical protein [Clostridia bacterium]